jgi:ribosomal protein L12E/L44/L45/RPP1/RPP2
VGADFINAAIGDPVAVLCDDEQRVLFSVYMAFQHVRGRSYRAVARASATDTLKLAYGEITDDGIRHVLQEKGLEPNAENMALFRSFVDQLNSGDVEIGPQQAAVIGMSGKAVEEIGLRLFARGWRIYQIPEILLTCDEPVVAIAGPPHRRTERGGVGNAGVVIYPLTPGMLLAMFDGFNACPAPPHDLNYRDVAALNREIAAASSTYVFERPAHNIASSLRLPKAPDPISRATPIPVDDTGEKFLVRSHRPSRWANAKRPPPWPVERWFRTAS